MKVRAMEAVYLLVEVVPFAALFLLVLLRYDNSFPLPLAVVAISHVVSQEPVPVPYVVSPEPVPVPHVVSPESLSVPHVVL